MSETDTCVSASPRVLVRACTYRYACCVHRLDHGSQHNNAPPEHNPNRPIHQCKMCEDVAPVLGCVLQGEYVP